MGVRHDYVCKAHGEFESEQDKPRCPKGCASVLRIFNKAPGILSNTSRNRDALARLQAQHMGLSDMSNRHGRTVAENQRIDNWAEFRQQAEADQTGESLKRSQWAKSTEGVGSFTAKAKAVDNMVRNMGFDVSTPVAEVKPTMKGPKPKLVAPDYRG